MGQITCVLTELSRPSIELVVMNPTYSKVKGLVSIWYKHWWDVYMYYCGQGLTTFVRRMASGLCLHGFQLLLSRIRTTLEEISLSLSKILSVSTGPHMVAITTHAMTMRYFLFFTCPLHICTTCLRYHSKCTSFFFGEEC
jgi:hypothetical protein